MASATGIEAWAGPTSTRAERLEGFRVRSPEGYLGFVDTVRHDPESGEPVSLVVRAGRLIVLVVPYKEIEAVVPETELILIDSDLSRLVADSLTTAA